MTLRRSLSFALGLGACTVPIARDAPPVTAPPPAHPPPAPVAPPPPDAPLPVATLPRCDADALLARLRAGRVDAAHFNASVLYTWTTAEQADALRAGGPLLVREHSPERGISRYDALLEALAARDPIARTLREPRFRRARFAWTNAWATALGWASERYGDRLLRVTLRDEAYILRVSARDEAFTAVTVHGAPVTLDAVRAHPERIGAVHFVSDVDRTPGTYLGEIGIDVGRFREYVLPNEAMIAGFELDTPAVHAALARGADDAEALRAWMMQGACPSTYIVPRGSPWAAADDANNPLIAWMRAGAIDDARNAPTIPSLMDVASALRAAHRGAPYTRGRPAP